jgi:hypothetical protein
MAVNIRNASAVPLKWGTTSISGYIVESDDVEVSGESTQLTNEEGDVVTDISAYGIKESVTLGVIPLTSTTAPAPGDTFTYTVANLKIIVRSVRISRGKGAVEKWTITGERFELITSFTPA